MAEPFAAAGDRLLRHDLEYLADRGLVSTPITTWPMSWADIAVVADSARVPDDGDLRSLAVLDRLKARVARETQLGLFKTRASLAVYENRDRIRTFEDQPRGSVEAVGEAEYTSEAFAVKLRVSAASDTNVDDIRLDGSYVGYVFKNVAITAGGQDSWWGPGQVGSLIYSNNARPVNGIQVRRNVATSFSHPWLRWIGRWSANAFVGVLESDRDFDSPYLLGARVAFKPTRSLELGVSRTAQWGGEGRPENFDSLVDLVFGRDNVGEGVSREQEPGNQLAGFDAKYTTHALQVPLSFYGQIIGEDEAGGFPSRYMGQLGLSTSFPVRWRSSTVQSFVEFSDTTCQFHESSRLFNCAYNNSIYTTGYRYRGQPIGHGTDNDSRQVAVGAVVVNDDSRMWSVLLRGGTLNRGGPEDLANRLAPTPRDFFSADVSMQQDLYGGVLDVGVGFQQQDLVQEGGDNDQFRIYLRWSTHRR